MMQIKGGRAGRFGPRCIGCSKKFLLVLSEDPAVAPLVVAVDSTEAVTDDVAKALGIADQKPKKKSPGASMSGSSIIATVAAPAPPPAPKPAPRSVTQTIAPAPAPAPARTLPPTQPATFVATTVAPQSDIAGKRLGGYEILQKLGQGGMGSVFLARQLSLDRKVAVKILNPQLAQDPVFIARFTREAYAAAQLSHHNIVQIHDIGEDKSTHYFSMEYVEGQTLAGVVRDSKRLDPETAVTYTLQAARGLKFAHDHAMIHRDVKPENLLINDFGLVKVADLGLVKRQGTSEITASPALAAASDASTTGAALSMGTPAYMAPEQAKDAAQVDVRADVYSLGCTLYDLLTGRPPFLGATAIEVMTKHATQPVPPPEGIAKDIPANLSAILMKMMAKKPDERYANMNEVIAALEDFLGVAAGDSRRFSPREEHTRALEFAVKQFNSSMWGLLRDKLIPLYFLLCAAVAGALAYFGHIQFAIGIAAMAILTLVSYITITGVTRGTHLFRQIRRYVFGASVFDWIKAILLLLVIVGTLILFDLQWWVLGFLNAAVVIALLFHFTVDRLAYDQKQTYIIPVEGMLKSLRQRGLDEDAIRQFICKFAGVHWEEFYESLFGYESKMRARRLYLRGSSNVKRKKWAAWRDPVIAWIDERLKIRKEEKERRYLAKVEERKFRAQGVAQIDARAQAQKSAGEMLDQAYKIRRNIVQMRAAPMAPPKPTIPPPQDKKIPAAIPKAVVVPPPVDDDEEPRIRATYLDRKYGGVSGLLLGSQARFLVGMVFLIPFLFWMYENNPHFLREAGQKGVETISGVHNQLSGEDESAPANTSVSINSHPQDLSLAPTPADKLVSSQTKHSILEFLGSYPSGLAGAILVFSALFGGKKMGLFMLVSVLLILCGSSLHVPTFGLVRPEHLGMVLGGFVAAAGLFLGHDA
jgi:serine/threonine protein kinase